MWASLGNVLKPFSVSPLFAEPCGGAPPREPKVGWERLMSRPSSVKRSKFFRCGTHANTTRRPDSRWRVAAGVLQVGGRFAAAGRTLDRRASGLGGQWRVAARRLRDAAGARAV